MAVGGLLKGALFLVAGAAIHRLGGSDELRLRGKGRRHRPLGAVYLACALGVAALPPFGPFAAKSLLEQAAPGWLPAVATATTMVTGAALLRGFGRIFLGLGTARDPLLRRAHGDGEPEEAGSERSVEALLLVPAALLAAGALALSFVPGLPGRMTVAAERIVDHEARAALVLHGVRPPPPPAPHAPPLERVSYAYGLASAGGAMLLALVLLYRQRLPRGLRLAARPLGRAVPALRTLHAGSIGDYVAYIVVGGAVLGAVWGIALG
jgi:multicomponent Na+:H+ antiporter subunit D